MNGKIAGDELLEVFDESGAVIGLELRRECHRNNGFAHRAVHVLVFTPSGELLLQKRSAEKDLYPLFWDTSVGGHLAPGESYREAAMRECAEELGFTPSSLKFLYAYRMESDRETELVETFMTIHDGACAPDSREVVDVRAFKLDELLDGRRPETFSPFFLRELDELRRHITEQGDPR